MCWQAHGETLGEAKLSCKPRYEGPPNNRFLKSEPHYPHELRGEAKLSCKKKNFEKFLPAHYTNNFVENEQTTEIRRFPVRFPACCRRVKRSIFWECVVSRHIIPLKKDSSFYLLYFLHTALYKIVIFHFPPLSLPTRPPLFLPAKLVKLSKLI